MTADLSMILERFGWLVDVAGVILLLWLAHKLWGFSPTGLFRVIVGEFAAIVTKTRSIGSLNALALLLTTFLGVFMLLPEHIEAIGQTIAGVVGKEHATALRESGDSTTLFIFEVLLAILSVWALSRSKRP